MRIVFIDNRKDHLDLIASLFPENDVRLVEVTSQMSVERLTSSIMDLIIDDTCLVFDLFLRVSEEKRQIVVVEDCFSIKTINSVLNSLEDNNPQVRNLRFFFMSNYIIVDNHTVEKIDNLFKKNRRYVATLQKPVVSVDDTWIIDSANFYGYLFRNNLENEFLTTSVKELFVNMILHGKHQG